MAAERDELNATIVQVALSMSPTVKQLLLRREEHLMRLKYLNTEMGLARKHLEPIEAKLKEIGYVF